MPALLRQLTRLAWPLVLSGVVTILVSANDAILLGRLGAEAVAVGAAAVAVHSVAALLLSGFTIPAQVLAARRLGAGDPPGAAREAGLVAAVALWTSLPLTAGLLLGAGPILTAIAGPAIDVPLGTDYLRLVALGLPVIAVVAVLRGFATGIGRPRAVLVITTVAAVVDVAASIVLLAAGAGTLGVAVGTLAGSVAPLVVAVIWTVRLRAGGTPVPSATAMLRPPGRAHRQAWSLGVPEALLAATAAGSLVVVTWLLAPDGPVVLATARVLDVAVLVVWTVIYGVAAAGTTMIAERAGGGDLVGVRRVVRVTAIGTAAVAVVCAAALPVLTPPVLRWAVADARVAETAAPVVWLAWLQVLWMAATATTNAVLRAHRDTRTPLLASLIGEYAVFLPVGWLLCRALGLELLGVFVAHHVFWAAFLVVGLLRVGRAVSSARPEPIPPASPPPRPAPARDPAP
ncbi:MAG: MATE family efflux transporter [Kineosporiaceae bacterium]